MKRIFKEKGAEITSRYSAKPKEINLQIVRNCLCCEKVFTAKSLWLRLCDYCRSQG